MDTFVTSGVFSNTLYLRVGTLALFFGVTAGVVAAVVGEFLASAVFVLLAAAAFAAAAFASANAFASAAALAAAAFVSRKMIAAMADCKLLATLFFATNSFAISFSRAFNFCI